MTIPRLLEQFDRAAEAPRAVPRLRRFILDLAVRGKLVEQDPHDEDAAELLKRIKAKKATRGAPPARRAGAPEQTGDRPFDLPDGWLWTRIRDVTVDRGQMVPDAPFTYIDVTSIDKEKGRVANARALSPEEAPSRARKLVEPGDVLYSCVRPYLLNIAVLESVVVPRAIASTAFAVLDGLGLVASRFLWITLRSPFMVECVEAKMRGQAYPAINDSDFALLPFPLPPLPEQARIVDKVDELMALCDRLEAAQAERETRRDRVVAASLQRLNEPTTGHQLQQDARFHLGQLPLLATGVVHAAGLRHAIVSLGIRGKLVAQDPSDEPALDLLKRVQEAKRQAGAARTGRDWTDDISAAALQAFESPDGWTWTRIGDTVERVTVGYVGPMKDQYVENGIPFLRSQNVRANRFREDGLIAISPQFHRSIIKSALAPGDVVVVRSGNVGTACVIPPSLTEANCSDLVVIKKPMAVVPQYLSYYLNSLAGAHVEAGTVGVALTHFNTKSVATMPLPLPPLAEQHRIVAKVDELMGLCDRLEAQIGATATGSSRLLDALLHDALGTPTAVV